MRFLREITRFKSTRFIVIFENQKITYNTTSLTILFDTYNNNITKVNVGGIFSFIKTY